MHNAADAARAASNNRVCAAARTRHPVIVVLWYFRVGLQILASLFLKLQSKSAASESSAFACNAMASPTAASRRGQEAQRRRGRGREEEAERKRRRHRGGEAQRPRGAEAERTKPRGKGGEAEMPRWRGAEAERSRAERANEDDLGKGRGTVVH